MGVGKRERADGWRQDRHCLFVGVDYLFFFLDQCKLSGLKETIMCILSKWPFRMA